MDEVKKKNPIPSLAGYGGVRSLQKKLERSTTLQQNREAVSYSLLCMANTKLTDIMQYKGGANCRHYWLQLIFGNPNPNVGYEEPITNRKYDEIRKAESPRS